MLSLGGQLFSVERRDTVVPFGSSPYHASATDSNIFATACKSTDRSRQTDKYPRLGQNKMRTTLHNSFCGPDNGSKTHFSTVFFAISVDSRISQLDSFLRGISFSFC